jgi:hypothetical protein
MEVHGMHRQDGKALETRAFVTRKESILPQYITESRLPQDVFIFPAASTRSLVAVTDGGTTRAFTQSLSWEVSPREFRLLDFRWETEGEHAVEDLEYNWIYDGEEVPCIREFARSRAAHPGELMRWAYVQQQFSNSPRGGGAPPGGLQLLMRQHELVQAVGTKAMCPSQPLLLVKRDHGQLITDPAFLALPALDHVFSGSGLSSSPLYKQVRRILGEVSSLSPWEFFRRSGSCAVGIFGVLEQAGAAVKEALTRTLTQLLADPLGMLGLDSGELIRARVWLGAEKARGLTDYVPWWFHDAVDCKGRYVAPLPAESLVFARRVDTWHVMDGRDRSGRSLGLPPSMTEALRQRVHPAAGDRIPLAGGSEVTGGHQLA